MTASTDLLETVPRRGRIALLDIVPSPAADEIRYSERLNTLFRTGAGRLAWAGRVDQNLVGSDQNAGHEIVISEFSHFAACQKFLQTRQSWISHCDERTVQSFMATPWPEPVRWVNGMTFALRKQLGHGPRPYDPKHEAQPSFEEIEMGQAALGPTPEQFQELCDHKLSDRVVMVNFLSFRPSAIEFDLEPPRPLRDQSVTGRKAYGRYSRKTVKIVGRLGGRLRWVGFRIQNLNPSSGNEWTQIALMEYPSRAHFIGMLRDPEYKRGASDRDAGLSRTRLLACTSEPEFH